jgi:hypothetical protein
MALSSVSVVVSSLLLNLYTPPGAPAWHQNVTRRLALAMKSQRAMSFNLVRRGRIIAIFKALIICSQMQDEGTELRSSNQVVVSNNR